MTIRVVNADDHQIFREGLHNLLLKETHIEVVGLAENGRRAVQLAQELHPQVIIMDVGMYELNGIEATQQIIANSPDIKIIALSMHRDKRFIIKMLQAGASGYIVKDCAFKELVTAIQKSLANQIYLSPSVNEMVIKDYKQHLSTLQFNGKSVLTPREREVLQLLAEGQTTKQIAKNLCISPKTVESHRKQIMDKLNIHSVAELTKFAIQEGITGLGT